MRMIASLGTRFWRPIQMKGRPDRPPLRSHSVVSS
jgi:hypothetical protein